MRNNKEHKLTGCQRGLLNKATNRPNDMIYGTMIMFGDVEMQIGTFTDWINEIDTSEDQNDIDLSRSSGYPIIEDLEPLNTEGLIEFLLDQIAQETKGLRSCAENGIPRSDRTGFDRSYRCQSSDKLVSTNTSEKPVHAQQTEKSGQVVAPLDERTQRTLDYVFKCRGCGHVEEHGAAFGTEVDGDEFCDMDCYRAYRRLLVSKGLVNAGDRYQKALKANNTEILRQYLGPDHPIFDAQPKKETRHMVYGSTIIITVGCPECGEDMELDTIGDVLLKCNECQRAYTVVTKVKESEEDQQLRVRRDAYEDGF